MGKQHSFDYQDLLRCGEGLVFGPDNARLPQPPMLMFDRVTNIDEQGGKFGKGYVEAEFDITPDLWFFKCHFDGDPVMPGCLGLDALWQLQGFFLGWIGRLGRGRALGVNSVKFSEQVTPNAKLVTYRVDVKRVVKRQISLGIGDGLMKVDGKVAYEAEGLKVTLFTAED